MIAVFNYAVFIARYPQFVNVSPTKLMSYFAEAGLYCNNTPQSRVHDVTLRGTLLNMLVAHISELNGDLSASGQSLPVGRVSQATEGTVSASLEFAPATPGSGPWFNQTQYGAAYWQATARWRSARYVPRPTRIW